MPKFFDGTEFDYTPEGIKESEIYAEATGQQPLQEYDAGGRVRNIPGYYGGGMIAEQMGGYNPIKMPEIGGDSNLETPFGQSALGLKKGGKVKKN